MSRLPLVFGHRGASCDAPENTIPAFKRAIELGADGVEFDVLLTKDGVPMVMHDDNLSCLTSFRGFMHETLYDDVKNLDAGSHFGETWRGEKIPTLSDVLALLKASSLIPMIELKQQRGCERAVVEKVGKLIMQFGLEDRCILSSFSFRILYFCKKLFPHLKRSFLISRKHFFWFQVLLSDLWLHCDYVTPRYDLVTARLISSLKKRQKHCAVWTVNTPKQMEYCMELGVESVITDHISLAQKIIKKQETSSVL
ncbi:MAG: hypothetical protein A3I05_07525 [Deltaproteobacteria bacterium RIFCSPLOWO2_02_FULL_44_10]|nr:MAG: hypothetical protein A3C46_00550 [Deltaproteobacteria bacterium RIFCSPHIGHO2_02_FULL_44_16]OGQ47374.1 MAG: hypothetical protein A3I05_07525 [Deltaproteobacteria bacterium RIFCSPLOWO2_02_FULL_44_10]